VGGCDPTTEFDLNTLNRVMAAPTTPSDNPQPGYQYNPKSSKKPWVGDQSTGGPETTKSYDLDAVISEPTGVLHHDLLRAVCGLASCTTKWAHQCDSDLHDNLYARKDDQRVRALERLESSTGSTTGARGGSLQKSQFQKYKRDQTLTANDIMGYMTTTPHDTTRPPFTRTTL
jgi:hypothetical protein